MIAAEEDQLRTAPAATQRTAFLPTLRVGVDQMRVTDEAVSYLARRPTVFQRDGLLVRMVRVERRKRAGKAYVDRPAHTPLITPIAQPTLSEEMSFSARWLKFDKREDDWGPTIPPEWCVRQVAHRGAWPGVRYLRAVVEHPVLRPDGTLLLTPGYDEATGLLFEPNCALPSVPDRPTQGHVDKARDALLHLMSDVPFAKPYHLSAWLAGFLTPFARYAYDGYTPFFLVDANVSGAGKTTLADIVSLVSCGRAIARTAQPPSEEEEEKRIVSILLGGDTMVLWDNIDAPFGSAKFCQLITGELFQGRMLGANLMPKLANETIWWGNGNNIRLRPKTAIDTARRTMYVRLESPSETPDLLKRTFADVLEHVQLERRTYMTAALTLLRAFCVHGRKQPPLRPWPQFGPWSEIVRGAVVFAGFVDPLEAHESFRRGADTLSHNLHDLMLGWQEVASWLKKDALTCADLISELSEDLEYKRRTPGHQLRFPIAVAALAELIRTPAGQLPSPRELGYFLRGVHGRVISGARFVTVGEDAVSKSSLWAVQSI